MRYIRFSSEEQYINYLNCTNIDKWIPTCITRRKDFIDVCSDNECNCDIFEEYTPTKWVLDPNDFECYNNDKYSVEKEYAYVNDKWIPTGNKRRKDMIEANSIDCFVTQCEYVPSEYNVCVGYDKYQKNIKRCTRYDGGYDYYPDDYQVGKLMEKNSADCGFVPDYDLIFEFSQAPQSYTINSQTFTANSSPHKQDVSTLGVGTVTNLTWMFLQPFSRPNYITKITRMFDTSKVTSMDSMFKGCSGLTSVPLFNTSNVSDMSGMFWGCEILTSVPQFDTSNVTRMTRMFYECKSLTKVPLFDTSKVTSTLQMFDFCRSLTEVPTFDTSNVVNTNRMFGFCTSLTTVPQFNTSKVTSMVGMFADCYKLTEVPTFDTSKARDIRQMFMNCSGMTSVTISSTNSATDMWEMFRGCKSLTEIDMSGCHIATTTRLENMFMDCTSLTKIILNGSDCDTINLIKQQLAADNITNVTIVTDVICE